ncbi:MAG: 3-deoxy-manno-octulosonate cytidylyltransferase [Phycisphaerales bacterium]|nr:3-deoxy-manno-octulosonate cytidylyltransferase [Phycisphaerales bacterium]
MIVIPARFNSTRLPGKPLLNRTGKYLIQHVVEQASQAKLADRVVVATDDQRIFAAVESFGGHCELTQSTHLSGTDRIAEVAARAAFARYDIVVNVQGDEPEIAPELIDDLIAACSTPSTGMSTASAPVASQQELLSPNVVKVVCDQQSRAMYFSRSVIPFDREGDIKSPADLGGYYQKHLGIYAYRRDVLLQLAAAPPCHLECVEKLEQLRALYLGHKILVIRTNNAPHGIDTPSDYEAFVARRSLV